MTSNQKVWYISTLFVLFCLLLAAILYKLTGHLFIIIFIAPPVIHYILRKRFDEK